MAPLAPTTDADSIGDEDLIDVLGLGERTMRAISAFLSVHRVWKEIYEG